MYNLDPTLWGPHLWKFSHYFTIAYPDNPTDEDKIKYKTYFLSLQNYLPCEKCRYNYKRHLNEVPLTDEVLKSRYNLINWLINFHNIVNVENGKPKYSYDDFVNEYLKKDKGPGKSMKVIIIAIFLVVFFIIINKLI